MAVTYKIFNIFPFPVELKILGSAPEFPKVCKTPGPGGVLPIPYPNVSMPIQIKKPFGGWSPTFSLKWAPGNISLPKF